MVEFHVEGSTEAFIRFVASEDKATNGEVVARALALYKLFWENAQSGGKAIVRKVDGNEVRVAIK